MNFDRSKKIKYLVELKNIEEKGGGELKLVCHQAHFLFIHECLKLWRESE